MKIQKFIIENYKAIRGRKELTPNGASFFLLGGNGVGKTSAGHAIIDMLTKSMPSVPVTDGEHTGYMEFTMTNGAKLLCKMVDGKKPVIEFITPEGYNVGAPKELLQQLAGEGMEFNIDDFLKLQPKPLREKLEKIAGLNLSEINQREAAAFDERKLAKAQLRDQQGRVQPYDVNLVNKEPLSAVEISSTIQELNAKTNEWQREHDKHATLSSDVLKGEQQVTQMLTELEAYVSHQTQKINAVKDLVNESRKKMVQQEELLKTIQAPAPEEIKALQAQLQEVETTNKAIADAKRIHQEFKIAQELELKVMGLEEKVKSIREEKENLIKASPIPAEGITFSEDGDILIDGLPFTENQISTSRKIIAGIQIKTSMLGDIKYLHFDGAALDHVNADKVLAYAEAHGLQLCIERPLWEGGDLKFEIHDHTSTPEAILEPVS